MSGTKRTYRHGPEVDCQCIISPECLREVRRRRMVSLDAVVAASGYAREYLSRLERGDAACVDSEVIGGYERALDMPVEEEVLTMIGDFLQAMWSGHDMLTRLYRFRSQGELPGQQP